MCKNIPDSHRQTDRQTDGRADRRTDDALWHNQYKYDTENVAVHSNTFSNILHIHVTAYQ